MNSDNKKRKKNIKVRTSRNKTKEENNKAFFCKPTTKKRKETKRKEKN